MRHTTLMITCALALAAACDGRTAGEDELSFALRGDAGIDAAVETDLDHDGVPDELDCDDEDKRAWQLLAGFPDGDGDGFTQPSATVVCAGAELPPPLLAERAGHDCDDEEPLVFRWVTLYHDEDGDGDGAGVPSTLCLGEELRAGMSLHGDDVDDGDPSAQEDEEEDDETLLVILGQEQD